MEHFTTSDHPHLNGPPGGIRREAWFVFADGEVIGEIEEDGDTYRGKLTGRVYKSDDLLLVAMTGDRAFRQDVFEFLVVQALFLDAKDRCDDIKLEPGDIDNVATGYPTIDGMPAYQWIEAMTRP